jgi:hypothetical protein
MARPNVSSRVVTLLLGVVLSVVCAHRAAKPQTQSVVSVKSAPTNAPGSASARDTVEADRLMVKMKGIIIPEIEIRQADIQDVVDFLNKAARVNDEEETDESKKGVNIVLIVNPERTGGTATEDLFRGGRGGNSAYAITFAAKHISLLSALGTMTSAAGLRWVIENNVVMIVPKDYQARRTEEPEVQNSPLLARMSKIIIPEIEFRQANIHDVVDFLNKAAHEGDSVEQSVSRRSTNGILNFGPGDGPATATPATGGELFGGEQPGAQPDNSSGSTNEITFTARYISLLDAVKIITKVAGVKYVVEGDNIVIVPMDYQAKSTASRKADGPP